MKTKPLLPVGDFLAPRTADGMWQLRLLVSGRRFVDLLQVSEHVGSEQAPRSTVTISEQIHQLYCTLSALPAMDALQGCSTVGGPSYDLTL